MRQEHSVAAAFSLPFALAVSVIFYILPEADALRNTLSNGQLLISTDIPAQHHHTNSVLTPRL